MRKSCVQAGHNAVLSASITSKINHRAVYKNVLPVHKLSSFTHTGVQTTISILCASTQLFWHFLQRRVKSYTRYTQGLLLTTTSFNLMKI